MKNIALTVALLCVFKLGAQETGTLKIFLSPPPETIIIDDAELEFGNTVDLKPGKYFLKAWAPNKMLLDTIVEVKAGQVTSFFYNFLPSKDYLLQRNILGDYKVERGKKLATPILTTSLIAGALVFTHIKGNSIREEALAGYDNYQFASTKIDEKAAEYTALQKKYRGYVTAYYIEWGALAVSSYYLYKGIKWARKNKAPIFDSPKNPLVLSGIGVNRDSFGNYVLGMTFNLGR